MFVAGQVVKLPSGRELVSRDARGWQTRDKKWVVFIFLCRSNCSERQCPGCPPSPAPPSPQRQMSLLVEKCSLPYPPHFRFLGEVQGNKMKSSIIPFSIENALEFELWTNGS